MSHRVVHFEIPSDDPEKSMQFFKDVFGWRFQQFGNVEYWTVTTGDAATPGINGGLMKRRDPRQPVANSIQVDNIDHHIKLIETAGGKVVVPKMAIPIVGWLAYFTDPDGNIHAIYQDDPTASV